MVFGRGYRKFRPPKQGFLTTNHCEVPAFATTAGTENQQAIFSTVEPPTNRGQHIPAGAILKGFWIKLFAVDTTPVNGKHSCLMSYRPGSSAWANPIASWLNTADPLAEEPLQIRQAKLGPFSRYVTITGASQPPTHICKWKGSIHLRDGDDIVLTLLDDNITSWEGLCSAWWIS